MTRDADELLELAQRLRAFARDARDSRYRDRFERCADDLEIEALGHVASRTVARALRRERARLVVH